MFERLSERARMLAERRKEARVAELTDRARAALPAGIEAEAAADGVRLSGRGLARRFVLEPMLRWILAGLR